MTDEIVKIATERILRPTIAAMAKKAELYKGCLYAGLMITKEDPRIVEFNARFGDPETQVVLPLLQRDLVDIMLACADGTLDEERIEWSDGAAVCVVVRLRRLPESLQRKASRLMALKSKPSAPSSSMPAPPRKTAKTTSGGRNTRRRPPPPTTSATLTSTKPACWRQRHHLRRSQRTDAAHRAPRAPDR